MFQRVLVANRGEIAVRVMRTLRDLGISPLAIYSEADAGALHARFADRALCVGPAASSESYLKIDAVIDAARRMGADAIHPGYGFLSENAEFARRVTEAGICWIGPPPGAIEMMGDKLTARRAMSAAQVPVVPGVSEPISDPEEAARIAGEIGYPVMLKASAGGGGRGLRRVDSEGELRAALEGARREAEGAFGDASVFIEKFIVEPHHIEIQVLCDAHGNALHFGERECSVQRRNQKVIEEAPSPFIGEELRAEMGAVAVRAAEACGYVGAGTVEFLAGADQQFYFLEMNTRLQVEHPVTELVYGVDLVEAQLRVAAGERLPWTQEEIRPRGAAIECRIYAEDPVSFMPAPGKISTLRWPSGPGVRVDAGVEGGSEVPMTYDPMVAKLCVWGQDRPQALRRMRRALEETVILGLTHNIPLHLQILEHEAFRAGLYDTGILSTPLPAAPRATERERVAALIASVIDRYEEQQQRSSPPSGAPGAWYQEGHQRMLRGG